MSFISTHSLQQRSLFPKTVIALYTIHGGYDLDKRDEVPEIKTYKVPEGLRVTNILGAPPGVCYNTTGKILDQLVQGFSELTIGKETIDEHLIQVIMGTLRELESEGWREDERTLREQVKQGKKRRNPSLIDSDLRSIVYKSDLFLRRKDFKPQEELLNKTFVNILGDETTGSLYDLKINLVNMEGIPNLLEVPGLPVRITSKGDTEVTLGNTLTFLKENGAEHVIAIDLACSSFGNSVSDRSGRSIRRRLVGKSFGGST